MTCIDLNMILNQQSYNSTDQKLKHLIYKIVKSSSSPVPNQSSKQHQQKQQPLSAKQIFDTLLNRHREYRRKNSAALLSSIEEILSQSAKSKGLRKSIGPSGDLVFGGAAKVVSVPIGQQQHQPPKTESQSGNKGITIQHEEIEGLLDTGKNKRKRIEANPAKSLGRETSDEEYDKAAEQNDTNKLDEIQNQGVGTSMLNANLRNRYKDVQRERDVISRKKSKEEENEQQQDQGDGNTNNQPLPTVSETTSTSSNSKDNSTAPATPLKKKKKKMSRSSSSNSLNQSAPYADTPSSSFITAPTPRPKERYSDLGGLSNILTQIRQLIEYPLAHPELFAHLGIHPPRGVLLRGPPGCGKTHIANAIAGQLNVNYYRISAPELVSGMSGESESRIRDLFQTASSSAPSIIFMDEIDAIAPKRGGDGSTSGGSKGMEKRMVAQLLTCMDSLTPENNRSGAPVMVLGATNRPDSIDSALRRAGRFDREIFLGVPDEEGRESILRAMTKGMRLSGDFDFRKLAKKTPGFVGADIRSLTKEAGVIAINRIFKKVLIDDPSSMTQSVKSMENSNNNNPNPNIQNEVALAQDGTENAVEQKANNTDVPDIHSVTPLTPSQLEGLYITMDDVLAAISHVQPSSTREGFATVPDVSWNDVGALQSIREELTLNVLEPITHPEKFIALGLSLPAGVLLYGPPGCGKTLLAKAIANESGANFISVKGPELLDKYVGESERAVRQVFERARSSSPCIVFFDELDSLCPKRGSDSSGGGVSERVVNQLLTEMDGLDSRRSVFVIAATNRPELIDPAMLRPGRLDKLLYVPLPSPADRVAILNTLGKNIKLAPDVSLDSLGLSSRCEGYSGADCAALLREAGLAVLRDDTLNDDNSTYVHLEIRSDHFNYAFNHVMPSVTRKDQARYNKIRDRMARARTRGTVADEKPATDDDVKENLARKET